MSSEVQVEVLGGALPFFLVFVDDLTVLQDIHRHIKFSILKESLRSSDKDISQISGSEYMAGGRAASYLIEVLICDHWQ